MAADRKVVIAGVVALGGAAALVWSGMRTFGAGGMGREVRSAASLSPQRPGGARSGGSDSGSTNSGAVSGGSERRQVSMGGELGSGPSWSPADGEAIPGEGGRRVVRLGGGGTGNAAPEMPDAMHEYEFTEAPAGVSGELALDRLERAWRDGLDAEAGLANLGMARREQLAKEARGLISALKDNDYDAWQASVRMLGAVIPEDPAPVREQFDRLSHVLASASLALNDAAVRAIDPDAPRGMLDMLPNDGYNANMIQRVMQVQEEGAPEKEIRVSSLRMAGGGLFPGVASFRDDKLKAAVVRVPVRIKGSKSARADGIFSVTMAWNAQANHWQPALWEMELFNPELMAGMNLRRGG
ncbi:MAG: hypothetical protein RBS39_01570 [Phycisphaerales bacterium]|jgi:hypothetical protein|nr:hypothetical protein [Phycisphaerales bacterium]